jgi:serine/threonine-protein kinase
MSELMYKIANEEAPDIRIIRPELTQGLADVVALSLSKRPETRYQTGEQFAADLRSVMDRPGNADPKRVDKADGVAATVSDPVAAVEAKMDFMETVPATAADFDKTTIQSPARRLAAGVSSTDPKE